MLETLIEEHDVRRAEVVIARLLRLELEDHARQRVLVYRARVRLLAARPAEALDDLKSAGITITVTPVDPDLLALLADCYLARFELAPAGFADRQDVRQAEALYTRLAQEFATYDNMGWIAYQHGRICLIGDRAADAEHHFRQALFQPARVAALTAYCYERLGYIAFYEQRQPARALTFLDKAVDTFPAGLSRLWLVQVHLLRSRVLREARPEQALQAAQTALKIAADETPEARSARAEALLMLAELYAAAQRPHEAITSVQQFLQVSRLPAGIDVTWSRVYELLGDACFTLERYEQALTAYQNVLVFNPYHPWEDTIQYRISRCYYLLRDYQRVVNTVNNLILKTGTEGNPTTDYQLYHLLGDAWFAMGRYQDSRQAYHTALQIAPAGADVTRIRAFYEQSR
ncbi:MAG: tetratricopeptide repeat protein [Anaerolineae bacterium]|nr:tetratricopeptide repeat protein [Anaerolineae bacterium]